MDQKQPKPNSTLVSLSAADALLQHRAALASDKDPVIETAKAKLERFTDDQLIQAAKFLSRIGLGAKD